MVWQVSDNVLNVMQGLVIDADVAAAAETAIAAGTKHMVAGQLPEALALFCEAAAGVPLRSKLGGEATLQRAICLDSMVAAPLSLFAESASVGRGPLLGGSKHKAWYEQVALGCRGGPQRPKRCTRRWSGTLRLAWQKRLGKCCLASR